MTLFSTYCSDEKVPDPGLLPALERYCSSRIQMVHRASVALGAEFRILSGKYGLLAASQEIPHYDHLLTNEEVAEMVGVLAGQLQDLECARVIFFSRSIAEDPCVQPYREAIAEACQRASTQCTILEIPRQEQSWEKLAERVRELLS